jgi:hypothetical protein
LYQNEKITLLSQDIVDFLNSHIAFRNQLWSMLQWMLDDSVKLNQKIQASK